MGADTATVPDPERRVIMGRISGLYGVRGWVRIQSFTRPRDSLVDYGPWMVGSGEHWRELAPLDHGVSGGDLVVRLPGLDDRDAARALIGADIAVPRRRLPALEPGEYYCCDLVGLRVVDTRDRDLGRVVEVRETGANDVLVVEGDVRRLVPFLRERVIRDVELDAGRIRVDWEPS